MIDEKQVLRTDRDQYWRQYDRFIEQLRVELRQLYWLYSFFFAVDSGLFFLFVKESRKENVPLGLLVVLGLLVSALWLIVFDAQRRVRSRWIDKVKVLDTHLDDHYRMWGEGEKGKGIAFTMLLLPLAFLVVWVFIFSLLIFE